MALHSLFPTRVYSAVLQRGNWRALNSRLLQECLQLRRDDAAGRSWSIDNYPGGYTSYASVSRMQQFSPTFALLERRLARHVRLLAATLQFELTDRQLAMTDCWVNIMGPQAVHGLHLHPLATLSGTYYVQTPRGSPGLKFEDPRLDRYMAAPPRQRFAAIDNRPWVVLPAEAGRVLLFESWLRHEVAANPSPARGSAAARSRPPAERVSISFNYGWF